MYPHFTETLREKEIISEKKKAGIMSTVKELFKYLKFS